MVDIWRCWVVLYLSWLVRDSKNKRKIKKFLTKRNGFDRISKLSREKNDRNLDNWTIDNNPWKFLWRENFSNSGDRASTAMVRRIYFSETTRASIGGANEARNFVSSSGAVEAEPNTVKGKGLASSWSEPGTNIFNESLILAQDERWRRA